MSSKSPNINESTGAEQALLEMDALRKALIKGEQSGAATYDCENFLKELDVHSRNNKPKYTLDGLLEKCDLDAPPNNELEEWDKVKQIGHEIKQP